MKNLSSDIFSKFSSCCQTRKNRFATAFFCRQISKSCKKLASCCINAFSAGLSALIYFWITIPKAAWTFSPLAVGLTAYGTFSPFALAGLILFAALCKTLPLCKRLSDFQSLIFLYYNTQGCVDFQPTCHWANCLRGFHPSALAELFFWIAHFVSLKSTFPVL